MKKTLLKCFTAITFCCYSQNSYYNSVDLNNIDSLNLKANLHNLIKNHNTVSYDACKTYLKLSDEDPSNSNNIILVYKQVSIPKENFASNNEPDFWNREHVWATSLGNFGSNGIYNSLIYRDLHNLKPSDKTVNSSKSNKSFDDGGIQHDEAIECNYTEFTWEPPDNVKGDIARILFYMDTRYEGNIGGNEPDLNIIEEVNTYPNPQIGNIQTLISWHNQDPVDEFETNRNNVIYNIQNNRNPFIDYPEFANIIWNEYCNPCVYNSNPSNDSLILPSSTSINLELKGIIDFDVPSGGTDGKAIHLVASGDIQDLSQYGLGIANNGGGSDGIEYTFDPISVSNGDDILVVKSSLAMVNYLGNCFNEFEYVLETSNNLTQNGNDAIELFFNLNVIETYGDIYVDGSGQEWEYSDSWAYKENGIWIYGGALCTNESENIFESGCIYPLCIEVLPGCIDSDAFNFNENANTDDGSCIISSCISPDSWDFVVTGTNHTIIIPENTQIIINNEIITNNLLIGGFYTNNQNELQCAGYTHYIGETTQIALFGNDVTTDQIDGFQESDEFVWIAYDCQLESLNNINITFYNGPSTYVGNGISYVNSIFSSYSQNLSILEGWNMISTYISTENNQINEVFSPINSEIIIIKNYLGLAYLPNIPFNGIGNLDIGQGYQIKMNSDVNLTLNGNIIEPENNPITLVSGWNMVAYLHDYPQSLLNIFNDLVENNQLIIVKNWNGLVYIPEINFNAIGNMKPGQGYQLKVTESTILQY